MYIQRNSKMNIYVWDYLQIVSAGLDGNLPIDRLITLWMDIDQVPHVSLLFRPWKFDIVRYIHAMKFRATVRNICIILLISNP